MDKGHKGSIPGMEETKAMEVGPGERVEWADWPQIPSNAGNITGPNEISTQFGVKMERVRG